MCLCYPLLAEGVSRPTEYSNSLSRVPCEMTKVSEKEWDAPQNSIRIRLHSTWRERGHPFPAKGETKLRCFPARILSRTPAAECADPLNITKVYYSPAPVLEFMSGSSQYADAYASWGGTHDLAPQSGVSVCFSRTPIQTLTLRRGWGFRSCLIDTHVTPSPGSEWRSSASD